MRALGWNPELLGSTGWCLVDRLPFAELEAFVTGEAALAGYWLHHREIAALELVGRSQKLVEAVSALLEEAGQSLFPGYHRFSPGQLRIDVEIDAAARLPAEGNAQTLEHLAIDRCLRLLGGGDPLLLIDLYFLSRARVSPLKAAGSMSSLDAAATPSALAVVLHEIELEQVPPQVLRPVDLGDLKAFRDQLVEQLAMRTYGS